MFKIKFGYCEKVTTFEKNLPLKIWRYSLTSNFKWKIFSNFVAFSECLNFTYCFFSLKIIPHWTVDLASDPDSEWLLHVMTPHFPTKKASETAQWPTGHLGAALKSWSQHSFKPLSDKLDFQPFDWSKKKALKNLICWLKNRLLKVRWFQKQFFLFSSLPKNKRCLLNVALATRAEVFCSIFLEELKTRKNFLRLTDL